MSFQNDAVVYPLMIASVEDKLKGNKASLHPLFTFLERSQDDLGEQLTVKLECEKSCCFSLLLALFPRSLTPDHRRG